MPAEELVYTIDYAYRMNNGQTGAGTDYLYADGSFENTNGATGRWAYDPTQQRFYLLHEDPCDTVAIGQLTPPDAIAGVLLCRTDPNVRGVWRGALTPAVEGSLPNAPLGDPNLTIPAELEYELLP